MQTTNHERAVRRRQRAGPQRSGRRLAAVVLALSTLPCWGAAAAISEQKAASGQEPQASAAISTVAKRSPAPRASSGIPASARLHYDVTARMSGLRYFGTAELAWHQDGQRYDAHFEIRALSILLRSQNSSGTLGAGGLQPLRFDDRTRSKNSERTVTFDREHALVHFSGGAPDALLEAGVQDRLSVLVQLAVRAARDPAGVRPGAQLTIPTAGPSDVQPWHFDVTGTPTLAVAGETAVRTLKMERAPRDAKDQRVEVWFAPEFGWLPVQLRITQQDGEFVEQRLKAIDWDKKGKP